MYPCVRPGDVLHIESRTVEQIAVGDIAVCRRPGYLFGHRTIRKGVEDGRPYIVTQPDQTSQGDDGPTYDEDVLGIVTVIERRGQRVDPRQRQYRWPMRFYLTARLTLFELSLVVRGWLIDLLAYVQRGAGYRRVAWLWLAATRTNVFYVVRLPLQAGQTHDLYHPLALDEFDVAKPTWQGRTVDCWTLALHLRGNCQPAAWATFVLRPPECPHAGWWVDDLQVRVRYRGAGFEEDLIRKAEEIFARGGITEARVSVPRQTPMIAEVFKGLGFHETGVRIPHGAGEGNAGQSTRIVLRKSILKR
jgi:ribosomal protein S18 acetylase RimI-like enzyme